MKTESNWPIMVPIALLCLGLPFALWAESFSSASRRECVQQCSQTCGRSVEECAEACR